MKFLKTLALVILFLSTGSVLYAQGVVKVDKSLKENYFGKQIYLYQDATNKRTFEQIRHGKNLFKETDRDVPNLGASSFSNWVKFTLVNDSEYDKVILEIPNPIIDEADLYTIRDGRLDSVKNSSYRPLKEREYNHQFYLFDIPIKKGDSVNCYIRLKSNQQILLPLSLKTDKTILTNLTESDTRSGVYLGIMAVMLLYNLFIYFTTKDADYLVYCHYIFWVALTQASLLGYSHRFLWTDNVWLSKNMVIFCGAMSGIATIMFAKSFLHTRKFVPKLDFALNLTILSYCFSLLILLIGNKAIAFQIVNLTAAIVSMLIIYVAWAVYRKKYASARFFLISGQSFLPAY